MLNTTRNRRDFSEVLNMSKHQRPLLLAALLIGGMSLLAPHAAFAQYNYYQSGAFAFNQFNYPPIGDSGTHRYKKPKAAAQTKAAVPAPSERKAGRASANNNPLPYARDKSLSAKLRDEFLADFTKQMTPAEAAEMRAMAEENDLVQAMAGLVQLQKLDSSATESLLAFWYGQSWAVANQKPLPTPQQYAGIADQLRTSLASSAEWGKMSNAQRQTFFEQLAYPLIIQKANYQAYLKQGKSDAIARMASATQAGMKKIGLDLLAVRLSDGGFVPF
jgi:hypothetical protein